MRFMASMNATILTVARLLAMKAVKRNMQAQGLKLAHVEQHMIVSAAHKHLDEHPELIEEAAETVRKVPQLRTLAEREERRCKGNRRWLKRHQLLQNEHCADYLTLRIENTKAKMKALLPFVFRLQCLLLAQSGHSDLSHKCPRTQ